MSYLASPRTYSLASAGSEDPKTIPFWYHNGMSKQLTVRLPDDLVDFIDQRVEHGGAASRAAVVAAAVERERRREIAARDVAILTRSSSPDELDDLADFATHVALDDLT